MKSKKTKEISGGSKLRQYKGSDDGRVRLVVVELTKDYPKKGWAINEDRTEAIYIIQGEVTVLKNKDRHNLTEGEVMYFEEGNRYKVQGKAKILVAITPYSEGGTEIVE